MPLVDDLRQDALVDILPVHSRIAVSGVPALPVPVRPTTKKRLRLVTVVARCVHGLDLDCRQLGKVSTAIELRQNPVHIVLAARRPGGAPRTWQRQFLPPVASEHRDLVAGHRTSGDAHGHIRRPHQFRPGPEGLRRDLT